MCINRYFLCLICCFLAVSLTLEAQQLVTGRITDAIDGTPIRDVQIFVANTTIGTTSGESGNYSITVPGNGSFEIVASHVGYQPVFHKIDAPKPFHQINFVLELHEISEVTITAHSNHSQKDVDLFWRKLLGEKPSKNGMEVLNPEKVYYFLNSENVLKVSCKEPIEILNHQMGYHIRFVLVSFKHDYRNNETSLSGIPYFEELTPQNNRQKYRWEKKRQEEYSVSLTRFIRALYRDKIREEGFHLASIDSLKKGKESTILPKDILQVDHERVLLNIEEPLFLICYSKPVSYQMINSIYNVVFFNSYGTSFPILVLSPQQLTIFPDGTYSGLLKINEHQRREGNWKTVESQSGSMHIYQKIDMPKSILGLSSKLPVEYVPEQKGMATDELTHFIQALRSFSNNISQEKVYLHFDNTSYYQGDHIWFKSYVVTPEQNQLSRLSKTLYVELLNPGGEIIDKRILPIENGQCHGEFTLNQLPFYSGFYEVRAYTKYMLNFGDDVIFSRLLPVFDKPKEEGNFEEKKMLKYTRWGVVDYPMKREKLEREKKVNLRFFPEGGNLVQDVASRVAFEVTDETGNPIDVTGVVMNSGKQELCRITTLHEGRGVFTYTPAGAADKRKDVAEVEYSGKKYRFDMPSCLPDGVTMEVDNLSCPDSIGISLRKSRNRPADIYGVTVISGGKLQNCFSTWIADDEVRFKMDKTQLFSGVSQITLFNGKGEILCDRLIFTNEDNFLEIKAKTNKPIYKPYELVNMDLSIADHETNPVQTTFSLSVRDGANEVESGHNILTDLLLMSEIKGYVRNPSYYFEGKNDSVETRRATSLLDLLLMVQGWRRYSWKQMAGVENFELKNLPEQGIETKGTVVTLVKQKPKPDVDVSLFLHQKIEEKDTADIFVESFVTDKQGRFSFVSDISGKWNMTLSVMEKGKKKDHLIVLDRVFSPEPRKYRFADMQVNIVEKTVENMNDEETPDDEDDYASFLAAYHDSIAKLGIDEKVHQIEEVVVKAKRYTKEQEILRNRTTSVAYYDVASELDNIYDRGEYVSSDIHVFLKNMNLDFLFMKRGMFEPVYYKTKTPIFVIDHERYTVSKEPEFTQIELFAYQNISLNAIKSIYINETPSVICQYNPKYWLSCIEALESFSCVVFIELYPEGQIPVKGAKGVRKTWLEGYSAVSEFYHPNYSELLPEPNDYRRTLYWNPMVTTDETGKAKINFYNNSSCTNFSISAETVTAEGMIGIYRNKE